MITVLFSFAKGIMSTKTTSSAVCSANPHNRHGFSWILQCCIVEWLTTSAPWPQSDTYWF